VHKDGSEKRERKRGEKVSQNGRSKQAKKMGTQKKTTRTLEKKCKNGERVSRSIEDNEKNDEKEGTDTQRKKRKRKKKKDNCK